MMTHKLMKKNRKVFDVKFVTIAGNTVLIFMIYFMGVPKNSL